MTTLADLRTQINNEGISSSVYTNWTTTYLNQVINDAIREYSNYFPRGPVTVTTACTASVREYALPSGFLAVRRVEFPTGYTPPRYLQRLDETDPAFSGTGPGYTGATSPSTLPVDYYDIRDVLVLSASPTTGQSFKLWYMATHTAMSSDSDVLTVPDRDLDILIAYVTWQAWTLRITYEVAAPSADMPNLEMMRDAAGQAKTWFDQRLRDRKRAGRGGFKVWASGLD